MKEKTKKGMKGKSMKERKHLKKGKEKEDE